MSHFPATGCLISFCSPPEPLSSLTHLHRPGCQLGASDTWLQASPPPLVGDCPLRASPLPYLETAR